MGLLDGEDVKDYYEGGDHGNYQFTSLDDVVSQFQIAYVGEDKLISKIRRADISFHAQRAMQELSFDTFKSTKAQEIKVPPSLTMILPLDYVNYTKISTVDASGIKHPLYPTNITSNPASPKQLEDGSYDFSGFLVNPDFDEFNNLGLNKSLDGNWVHSNFWKPRIDKIFIEENNLKFRHGSRTFASTSSTPTSSVYYTAQRIEIGATEILELEASVEVAEALALFHGKGTVRIGISTLKPGVSNIEKFEFNAGRQNPIDPVQCKLVDDDIFDLTQLDGVTPSFIDFNDALATTKTMSVIGGKKIPLRDGKRRAYIIIISRINNYLQLSPADSDQTTLDGNEAFNIINSVNVISNISGKTVILDYISDSLGTDDEMQVHKFAEEAMYKCIAYAILSTRANTQEYIVQRFKKERFAAIRTAKLRLSNIKIGEITQILRGKSKQIKH